MDTSVSSFSNNVSVYLTQFVPVFIQSDFKMALNLEIKSSE